MALKKEIILENGIPTNYHRIVSINKITNNTTIIEIASYLNEETREKEKNGNTNIYIATSYESIAYDENNTIVNCYNELVKTEKYKDAEQI